MEYVVKANDVSIYQDTNLVLSAVSFQIEKGEFVYLIGRTGTGKSSLLKTLYADLALKVGEVEVVGIPLKNIKPKSVSELRRRIGIIFQDFQLLFDRSVSENLMFVLRATGWDDSAKMKQRVATVMAEVGLGSVGNKMPFQLSGGEQQRVAIARALLNEPLLLIADEPTGNLDPEVGFAVLELFRSINRKGTAILMATHNHAFLRDQPNRILKCEDGRLLDSNKESLTFLR